MQYTAMLLLAIRAPSALKAAHLAVALRSTLAVLGARDPTGVTRDFVRIMPRPAVSTPARPGVDDASPTTVKNASAKAIISHG
jgi:hypothetical protein